MLRRFTLTQSVQTMRSVQTLLLAATLMVCLTPLRAQDMAAAKVVTLVGDVSCLKDGPTGNKWALNEGQSIQARWIIKTGKDGYAKFQVSDGSTFEVFPNSEVTFRQDPGNWTHLLNVWIGHIKVMIQHLPGVANPNNVTSPTAVISVRGTIFDVRVDQEATTQVWVEEGLVSVEDPVQGPEVMVQPGFQTTVKRGHVDQQISNADAATRSHACVRKNQNHQPERTRAFAPPAGGCATAAGPVGAE